MADPLSVGPTGFVARIVAAFRSSIEGFVRGWTPTDDEAAELGFTRAEVERAQRVFEAAAAPLTLLPLAMDAARYFMEPLDQMAWVVVHAHFGKRQPLKRLGIDSLDELRFASKGAAKAYATTINGQALVRAARSALPPDSTQRRA